MNDELLPCPHCGSQVHIGGKGERWYSIECDTCDTTLEPFVSASHAAEMWNRRVPTAPQVAATPQQATPDDVLHVLKVAMQVLETDLAMGVLTLSPEVLRKMPTAREWLDTPVAATTQPLDMPDSPGWFAFEGYYQHFGLDWGMQPHEKKFVQIVVKVIVAESPGKRIFYAEEGNVSRKADLMTGKWYKLTMPWQAQPTSDAQE